MLTFIDQNRRRFLQLGFAGLATIARLPGTTASGNAAEQFAPSPPRARARSCILLYMDGGPSHIDLFDLKPDAPADIRGPYTSIATSVPGIRVCEHLPRVASQMHCLAQIRSVRHDQSVHDPAVYQMLTGYRHLSSAGGLEVEETDMPHLGCSFSQADRAPTSLPRFIQVPDVMKMQSRILPGQNAGILPGAYAPFQVNISHRGEIEKPNLARPGNTTIAQLRSRYELYQRLERQDPFWNTQDVAARWRDFRSQALALMNDEAAQRAFDLDHEPAAVHERYGRHRQGQATLLARRLVEAGTRFVTVYWGNEEQDWADGRGMQLANNPWDTHRNHFPLVKDSLLPRADQTLAALLADLAERQLLDQTLVVWMGDFGRTPRINKQWASRDHWPHAFTVLLAGAGLAGGTVFGRTDRYAEQVEEQPVSPADLTATMLDCLGVEPATRVKTRAGGWHRLSSGRVIHELF